MRRKRLIDAASSVLAITSLLLGSFCLGLHNAAVDEQVLLIPLGLACFNAWLVGATVLLNQ